MGEACDENHALFKRYLAGLCALTTGHLTMLCGFTGIRSLYNNKFHWHERKCDKIKISKKALNDLRKEKSQTKSLSENSK